MSENNNNNNKKLTSNNHQVLQETRRVQSKTRESLYRIQQQAEETSALGGETLEELQNQRQQIYTIEAESHKLNAHLSKTNRLFNQFDVWSGHWRGSHKKQAQKEAQEQLKISKKEKENEATVNKYSYKTNVKSTKTSKDVLHSTCRHSNNDDNEKESPPLSNEEEQVLLKIQQEDDEIDILLVAVDDALDQLDRLALSIKEETQVHSQQIQTNHVLLEKAHTKQHVINGRIKRVLGIGSK